MSKTPQIIVSLSPLGQLQVELPGAFATRRVIVLTDAEAVATLKRILHGQLAERAEIGEDGAPTIAEGRVFGVGGRKRSTTIRKDGEVEIRRISRFNEDGSKALRLEDLED